jgi:hypothetical protein
MAQVTPKARTGEGLKDLLDYPDQVKPTQENSTGLIPDWAHEL